MLAGCESVDEGVTDYRKATINTDSGEGGSTNVQKKYELSNIDAPGNEDVPIKKGDTYYVSLLQAFVGPDAEFNGDHSYGGRQEIVLILRVRDSNDERRFGRFVFYSDDVSRGQFLNFSNLLTVGPARYCGGAITIDVDEIHLDGATHHIKEMLEKLAPYDHAFGPDPKQRHDFHAYERDVASLFDLVDRDSYGTRYTLTLLPSGGVKNLPYPRFEAGNYVVMRHERRDNPFEWGNLLLDNNTGRLVDRDTASDPNAGGCPRCSGGSRNEEVPRGGTDFRKHSYVTLQINTLRNIPENTRPEMQRIERPRYRSLDYDRRP